MSISFKTTDPAALLKAFNTRIEQDEQKGKIKTWKHGEDKKYYTHSATDWTTKAWFKPVLADGWLCFNIIKPKNMNVSALVYAYYHGHLLETFTNHFDQMFEYASSSAMPTENDNVSA